MRTEVAILLNAAAEAIRPHWPHVEIADLPDERDISLPHVDYQIIWPGYRGKKEPGGLLLFRCGTQVQPETVEHLIDLRKAMRATAECIRIAKARSRMAQNIRESQRQELEELLAEANGLAVAGLVPADQGEVYPLYPVVHRILSLHTPRFEVSPEQVRRAACSIISGELALDFRVESQHRHFTQAIDVTVMTTDSASLHMHAELHQVGVTVSWHVTTNGAQLPITAGVFEVCAERVAMVCRTPREALALKGRLDALKRFLTE